jgi:hypothetical protein
VSVPGVSVPHYWLGMVLVIIFSVDLNWLPPTGAGPDGSSEWRPDAAHLRYIILPALTMSVIPMGVIARTVRALVADILNQEFVQGLRAKGLREYGVFRHVVTNAAPTALAVMGLQLGYLLGGSILVETVFSWPGTGFLLNAAIFQRDLPLLQGTILVLAMFFVLLNLLVAPPTPTPRACSRRAPTRRSSKAPASRPSRVPRPTSPTCRPAAPSPRAATGPSRCASAACRRTSQWARGTVHGACCWSAWGRSSRQKCARVPDGWEHAADAFGVQYRKYRPVWRRAGP